MELTLKRCLLLALLLVVVSAQTATLRHEWVAVDYDFGSDSVRKEYIQSKKFIPENNAITGVKVNKYTQEVFVTVPRWRPGVPSTLNKVVTVGNRTLLQPYPSLEWQMVGDERAFQSVQSMEIDNKGRMWVIDFGRINMITGDPALMINGPAKLVILDSKGKELRRHVFPPTVLPYNSSFLNDIVVDVKGGVAYMSDAGSEGAIIVYDYKTNRSRRVLGGSRYTAYEGDVTIQVNGQAFPSFSTPEDGIALSADAKTLYFCALRGVTLHSVPTAVLRTFSTDDSEIEKAVKVEGRKDSGTDGLAFSSNGLLYFGSLNQSAVYYWRPGQPLTRDTQKLLVRDRELMQWVDTFAFDGAGSLWFTSNRLQQWFTNTMDFTGASGGNFRIWSVYIDGNSYING
eukprot:Colp12_sorted_trinity150504_noHs@27319